MCVVGYESIYVLILTINYVLDYLWVYIKLVFICQHSVMIKRHVHIDSFFTQNIFFECFPCESQNIEY